MDAPSFNPYAPPQVSNPAARPDGECFRQGKLFIVPRENAAYVPCDSCVKCGQPATKRLPRHFYWHHPALYLLILPGLLLYVLVAVIVRKQMRITIGLCDRHRAVRRWWITAAWLLLLSGLAFFVTPLATGISSALMGIGFFLLSLIIACVASNITLRPRRITKDEGAFAGAGEGFLQQFPAR